MASDKPLVYEERPGADSFVRLVLDPRGLIREEFSSGVPTHREVVPYAEIWDTSSAQAFPSRLAALLSALTLGFVLSLGFMEVSFALSALNGATLGAAWALLLWRAKLRTVKVFDYDGYEIANFHGLPGAGFDGFVAGLETRVAAYRYPLQLLFESLDLGRLEVAGTWTRWTCSFLYDRVVLSRSGPPKRIERAFFALSSLEAPIRLAWRVPWFLFGAAAAMAAAGLALATSTNQGPVGVPPSWIWGTLGVSCLLSALGVALTSVAVEIATAGPPVRLPRMPWWRRARRREALAWFARIVSLADRLEEIPTDDYWDFHRAKLQILREEGFLGDWPYRSALARLNSQEREEPGE